MPRCIAQFEVLAHSSGIRLILPIQIAVIRECDSVEGGGRANERVATPFAGEQIGERSTNGLQVTGVPSHSLIRNDS